MSLTWTCSFSPIVLFENRWVFHVQPYATRPCNPGTRYLRYSYLDRIRRLLTLIFESAGQREVARQQVGRTPMTS